MTMSEIKFNISVDSYENREVLSNIFEEVFDISSFASDVANEIDIYALSEEIAQNVDWSDISDAIYENMRDNNLQDLADSLASNVSDFLMEGQDFYDAFESAIEKAVAKYYDDGILSSKFDVLNNRIVELENKIASMNKKKFWKKMMKGK